MKWNSTDQVAMNLLFYCLICAEWSVNFHSTLHKQNLLSMTLFLSPTHLKSVKLKYFSSTLYFLARYFAGWGSVPQIIFKYFHMKPTNILVPTNYNKPWTAPVWNGFHQTRETSSGTICKSQGRRFFLSFQPHFACRLPGIINEDSYVNLN